MQQEDVGRSSFRVSRQTRLGTPARSASFVVTCQTDNPAGIAAELERHLPVILHREVSVEAR